MTTVLVIDDSLTIRKLVELSLRGSGIKTQLCADAQAGRQSLERNTPDIILLDYILPDINGPDFLEQLPDEYRNIPVIIMTAKDPSVREQFNVFEQVSGFLSKPFSQEQLLQKLRSVQVRNESGSRHQH